jgi:hypothetical protein
MKDSKDGNEDLGPAFAVARRSWGGNGPGSNDKNTSRLLQQLPALFKRWRVTRVADLGCGDVSWFAPIALSLEYYVGVDVVPQVIRENQRRWPTLEFKTIKGPWEDLGSGVDLVICRDCIAHLTSGQVSQVLAQIARAGRLALITNHPSTRSNEDIKAGGYRPVNLQLRPFRLPAPLEEVTDSERKVMALWNTSSFTERPR